MGEGLGGLAYRLGWRRRVVETQIARAFPDRAEEWARATGRATFRHVGREWLTLPFVSRVGLEEVRRRIVAFEGQEVLAAAYEEGRGLVVVSGHFGNWDLAGSTLAAYGYPVDAVMQGLRNPSLTRFVKEFRGRMGMGLIDRASAWGLLTSSIAAKRVVAFVADQDAGGSGVFVPFFGRPASTHRAPALLALRTGAPFLVGGAHRVGPQEYHAWIVRLDPQPGADTKEQVYDLTRRWIAELERRVRLSPEQYFWHHKRWKSVPPGTDPDTGGISNKE
jgi:KDO2-lipid IV(A) lauroyltransferase